MFLVGWFHLALLVVLGFGLGYWWYRPTQECRSCRLLKLKAEVRRRLDARARRPKPTGPAPRYDETFYRGVAWLNRQ